MNKIYPTRYETVTIGENMYLAGYLNYKCIGFYENDNGDFYPLLKAQTNNEEFKIAKTKNKLSYVLKIESNNIISIYSCNLKKLFETKENQRVTLVTNNLEKLGIKSKNNISDNLFVNLYENNSSILYDVFAKEEVLKGSFTNSEFYFYKTLILEVKDNEIKAIYYKGKAKFCDKENKLILKTKWKLKIIQFHNDYFVVESNPNNTYSSIYYIGTTHMTFEKNLIDFFATKTSYNITGLFKLGTNCRLLESGNYLFNINSSYYTSILNGYEAEMLTITGSINGKCKALYFFDNKNKEVLRYKTLNKDSKDNRYFVIDKTGLIKVMLNDKCIKIMDYNFNTILSIANRKCHTGNIFFKIYSDHIEKNYKENCIAIYSLTGELLAATNRFNINIKTCSSLNSKMCFLYMLNDKCIEIRNSQRHLSKITDVEYDVHFTNNGLIKYVYGIKDKKVVGIFDSFLNCIEWIQPPYKGSLEIIDTKYQTNQFLYLKKDGSNRVIEILDNEKKIIFKAGKDSYLKVFQDIVLEYDQKDICRSIIIIKNNKITKIYHTTQNEYFKPLLSNSQFIRRISSNSKNESLIYIKNNESINICSNYERLLLCDNYFLFLKNNSTKAEIALINTFYVGNENQILNAKYGGSLRAEISDPKGFIHLIETVNDIDVAVYSVNENRFEEILYCENGIEEMYIGKNIFFKTANGIFNKIGNEI